MSINQMIKTFQAAMDNYIINVPMADGTTSSPEVDINGKKYINFISNSYMGLGNHPEVKEAIKQAVDIYGMGSGASRLVGGTLLPHLELENEIASLKDPTGKKKAIIFSTGFLANSGAIPAIMSPLNIPSFHVAIEKIWKNGEIYSDHLNHRCIIDGISLAVRQCPEKIKVIRYEHNNAAHLEKLLSKSQAERKLIITDGVFSLNGHIAPLDKLVEIAQHYNATIYVDDAHATGVLGDNGGGTGDHYHLSEKIDIQMGTFSKAIGGEGGFIVADEHLIEYLRCQCSTYIFQTAMPPCIASGLIASLKIIKNHFGKKLRMTLKENADYLRQQLKSIGYNTLGSNTQIIPIFIGDKEKAALFASSLKDACILSFAYYYPAVPKNESIIRVNLMAQHTKDHIHHFLNIMEDLGKKFRLI